MPSVHLSRPVLPHVLDRARRLVRRDDARRRVAAAARRAARRASPAATGCSFTTSERVDGELLDAAGPALRIVANHAVGFDNVDLDAATERDVLVSNTPGVLTRATAEFTLALVLDRPAPRQRGRPAHPGAARRGSSVAGVHARRDARGARRSGSSGSAASGRRLPGSPSRSACGWSTRAAVTSPTSTGRGSSSTSCSRRRTSSASTARSRRRRATSSGRPRSPHAPRRVSRQHDARPGGRRGSARRRAARGRDRRRRARRLRARARGAPGPDRPRERRSRPPSRQRDDRGAKAMGMLCVEALRAVLLESGCPRTLSTRTAGRRGCEPPSGAGRADRGRTRARRRDRRSREQLRTYECDGLTGRRVVPALVALPALDGARCRPSCRAATSTACRSSRAARAPASPAEPCRTRTASSISLARMNRILEIDLESGRVTVEPGVTNLAVTQAVAPHGFYYAPDPSSQQVCTIGGNVAENSGGAHCLKHGFTVTTSPASRSCSPDGELVHLGGKGLDDDGLDLIGRSDRLRGHARASRPRITLRILRRPETRADAARRLRLAERGGHGRLRRDRRRHPRGRDGDHGSADARGGRGGRPPRISRTAAAS